MYFKQLHFQRLKHDSIYFLHGEQEEHLSGINKCFTENPVALSNLPLTLIAVM